MIIKKSSLARDFTIFSAIILLAVFITSICVGLIVHHSYYNKQEAKIANKANLLDQGLSEYFNIVTHYAHFLGNKITRQESNSPNYIKQIFSNEAYYDPNNESIWTKFGWIKPNKKLLVISDIGSEERDLSMRSFLNKTPIYPNKLQFSPPTIGILSNKWVLPAGVGIVDKHGEFLGTINTGFNLERLAKKLDFIFDRKDLVFMLFNDEMKFILASDNIGLSYLGTLPPENFVQQIKTQISKATTDEGLLNQAVDYYQSRFTYFKHFEQYPFYIVIGENIRVANNEYWQITFPRIAELTMMGLLFIILLYYFRQHIVRPIILLANSAKNIAAGDLNSKVYYGQYQEVNLLADQLKEIQNTRIELINAKNNVDLVNKNLEYKVKERTIELEKALAVKTEFLNNISHEVRTPVQGITSISQGLVEHWDSHSEAKKLALASAVANNSQRLFSLVSNLLDLSIFNNDEMYFNLQEADLIPIIENIIIECQTLYLADKNITISFLDHPKEAKLWIDAEKVLQVLRNLLTNSIKFMHEGSISILIEAILIENSNNPISYTIIIKDEGIGIPVAELEQIFSPFVQSSKTKTKVSGAGLGLAISKKIILGHHGKIWAKNNKNAGVSLSFTLPVIQPKAKVSKLITLTTPKITKILMIDDEPTCQMSMDILLSSTGYTLVSAYGGISGLEYLSEHYQDISIILLDLMMPDIYGLNVLTTIKADPRFCNIPVIIQSGTNDIKEIEKCFSVGAIDYIRKPYQRQQIIEAISAILG